MELKLQDLWIKDVAITTGLVSATTTLVLLRLFAQGRLDRERFVSQRFTFDSIMDAYNTFGRAAQIEALKVVITRRQHPAATSNGGWGGRAGRLRPAPVQDGP